LKPSNLIAILTDVHLWVPVVVLILGTARGFAWGALVFGELSGLSLHAQMLVIAGSAVMIAAPAAIGMAEAPASELSSWKRARNRECGRYRFDPHRVAVLQGNDPLARQELARHRWEAQAMLAALGIFGWPAHGRRTRFS
jgi:hypothetical protein